MNTTSRAARLPSPRRLAGGAAVLLCAAASVWAIAGQAAPVVSRQTFVVTDFDTIRLEAPIDVTVVTGKGSSAIGTGDRDTLDSLDLSVTAHVLVIRLRSMTTLGGSGGKARAPTRIALTTGDLHRAILLGSGTLSVDRLKGDRVEATVRGAGVLTVPRIEADRIDVGLMGAGTMTLAGTVLDMTAAVSGSGRLDASALEARRLRIDTEGAVDAQAKARDEAFATASGTGRLMVTGKAQCTVRKTGNASISCSGEMY